MGGRPAKLTLRDQRHIQRALSDLRKTEGHFTSDRLMEVAGISKTRVSGATVRRY